MVGREGEEEGDPEENGVVDPEGGEVALDPGRDGRWACREGEGVGPGELGDGPPGRPNVGPGRGGEGRGEEVGDAIRHFGDGMGFFGGVGSGFCMEDAFLRSAS